MKKLILILLVVVLGGNIISAYQKSLTLEEAFIKAMENNLEIKIHKNTSVIAKNNVLPGKAGLLPTIDLNGSLTHQKNQGNFSDDINSITNGSYSIQSRYTLFDGFGNIYRFKGLKIQNEITQHEVRSFIEIILLEVSQSYYSTLLAFEQYRIAQESLNISEGRFKRAEKKSQIGRMGTLNFLSAKVDLTSDQITLVKAKNIWDNTRRHLNVLLNQPLDTKISLDLLIEFNTSYKEVNLLSRGLSKNSSYLAVRAKIQQAKARKKQISADYFPQLSINASYGMLGLKAGLDLPFQDLNSNPTIGLSLNYNLFNGWQRSIDKKNAQLRLNNSQLAKEYAKKELEKDIINSHESFQNEIMVMELEEEHLKVGTLNFERTQQLFNLGQVTTTQFREAQLNLIQAKTNLVSAKINAKLKEINLLYLTGELIKE